MKLKAVVINSKPPGEFYLIQDYIGDYHIIKSSIELSRGTVLYWDNIKNSFYYKNSQISILAMLYQKSISYAQGIETIKNC
ncbi:hypothetical protein [Fusobacterium sp.]|uniref:hypothetical protein n=1 Tax=Fusobacterium sp. TaxID=68766 RepID=UPI0028FF33F9|nr:hypothetical protein [Fusobacterium sp.]MDU1911758.1 hypothetical protein [Fusobacterium sp.]